MTRITFPRLLIAAFLLFFLSAGCSPTTDPAGEAEQGEKEGSEEKVVQVVTTLFPLGDIVSQIGGEKVEVTVLLPRGSSPHTFEPTAEQARKLSEADLIVFVGGGLDNWAMKVETSPDADGRAVELTDKLEKYLIDYQSVKLEEEHGKREAHANEDGKEAHDEHHHQHGPHDPHIWMDPVLVRDQISPLIAEKLSSVLPGAEDYFEENLEAFKTELTDLHRDIETTVERFARSRFISYHSAWRYFAERYGLQEVASVEEFPGKEPSARWIKELVDLAETYEIEVIFAEPQLSPRAAEVIAGEINGEVLVLDPLGGEGIEGRDSYITLLRYNTGIFEKALR